MTIYAVVTSGGTIGSLSQFDSTSVVFGQPVQFIKDASSVPSSFEGTFSTWTQAWAISDVNQLNQGMIDEIGGVVLLLTNAGTRVRSLTDGSLMHTFPSQTLFGERPSSVRNVYTVISNGINTAFMVLKNGSVLFTSPLLIGIVIGAVVISFSGKYISVLSQNSQAVQLWVGT